MNLGSESEFVEFKKSAGEHKEALQAISAMLNKHGRGSLYFGVRDNGDVVGQMVSDSTIKQNRPGYFSECYWAIRFDGKQIWAYSRFVRRRC